MYEYEENLFGIDMRHKPPLPQLLTAKGYSSSIGRLHYAGMNRQQDMNISEYACRTIGFMPKGFVIIDRRSMNYDPNTAIKVNDFRVAIPVKEFARQRGIDVYDQWELINYKYIGSFDPSKDVRPHKGFKTLPQAYEEAMENGSLKEFLSSFYDMAVDDPELCQEKHERLKYVECEVSRYREIIREADNNIWKIEGKANSNIALNTEERKALRTYRDRRRTAKSMLIPLLDKRDELRDFIRKRTLSL